MLSQFPIFIHFFISLVLQAQIKEKDNLSSHKFDFSDFQHYRIWKAPCPSPKSPRHFDNLTYAKLQLPVSLTVHAIFVDYEHKTWYQTMDSSHLPACVTLGKWLHHSVSLYLFIYFDCKTGIVVHKVMGILLTKGLLWELFLTHARPLNQS